MRNTFIILVNLLLFSGVFCSCEKEEGEGGEGSIVGKVFKVVDDGAIYSYNSVFDSNTGKTELINIIKTNNAILNKLYGKNALSVADKDSFSAICDYYSLLLGRMFHFGKDTIVGCDEDVFIIYGNHEYGYDDKVKTSFDGTYRFNYLNDGNYKIYAYNDNVDGKEGVVYDVKLDGGQVYGGDFYINDGKNANLCGVVGYLEANFPKVDENFPGVDQRVYLREENGLTTDDCRVDENGFYVFAKLKPNTVYFVWAITEPQKNEGLFASVKKFKTGAAGSIVPGPFLQPIVN